MPDLTLCNNAACPLRETCYRFTAPKDDYQSMANFTPKDGACEYYINREGRWTEKIKFSE